jgi:DNA invertase Pin-like site-specific DNA recombinase
VTQRRAVLNLVRFFRNGKRQRTFDQTGLQFDLRSAQGKLIASLMAALAEFERDLLRERVRSGIAAARKRGVVFGRRRAVSSAPYER